MKKARSENVPVGMLRPVSLWPFPEKALQQAIDGVTRIIVPEMNIGKICSEIQRLCPGVEIVSLAKVGGELHTPGEILKAVENRD